MVQLGMAHDPFAHRKRQSRQDKSPRLRGCLTFAPCKSSATSRFRVPRVPIPLVAALGRIARKLRIWFNVLAPMFPDNASANIRRKRRVLALNSVRKDDDTTNQPRLLRTKL